MFRIESGFTLGSLVGVLLTVGAASPATADLVKPVGVAATSFYGYNQHPTNLINGNGLSSEDPSATHIASSGAVGMWHAAATYGAAGGSAVVANQSLTFTLPGVYDLTQAYIWQFNQTGTQAVINRGISQYDLLVSSDGYNFTPVLTDDILPVAQATDIAAETRAFDPQANVRFVRLQIDSTHNATVNDYVGLSEIRFEGTQISSGPVFTSASGASAAALPIQPVSNDLLQGAIATSNLTTFSNTGAGGGAGNEIAGLTDGIGDASFAHRVVPTTNGGTWDMTFSAASMGLGPGESLNIDRINVFGFNTDNRRFVDFNVEYTTDDINWQNLFIGASNGFTATAGSPLMTMLSLGREDSEDLVSAVRGLRFSFRPTNGTGHSSIVELDVLGEKVGGLPGDFDGDGDVDGADFVTWQTNFPLAAGATKQQGDADGDEDVDGADLAAWQDGFPSSAGQGTTVVPEPASMIPLLLGGIIVLVRRQFLPTSGSQR